MSSLRPFRFGVQASSATSRKEWIDLAQRAEDNGYDVLTMPDHFGDQLAPVPALMAAASATTALRVGALVWDNDYKHPLVLAKELATIDLLSDGRLEVGIGAGWMISDYEQAGMPYDSAKVRIDRFEEGVQVIKGCFGDGPFSHSGTHYTITDYNGIPKPVQGRVPLLIGGGGKRVLSVAAREADIIGINGTMHAGVIGPDAIATMTADAVDAKVDIVRNASGDRMADIEMNVRVFMLGVTDDRASKIESLSKAIGVRPAFMDESPFALFGTTDEMIETLRRRRERWGFSYMIVGADDIEPFAPVVAALRGT